MCFLLIFALLFFCPLQEHLFSLLDVGNYLPFESVCDFEELCESLGECLADQAVLDGDI